IFARRYRNGFLQRGKFAPDMIEPVQNGAESAAAMREAELEAGMEAENIGGNERSEGERATLRHAHNGREQRRAEQTFGARRPITMDEKHHVQTHQFLEYRIEPHIRN